MTNCHKPHTPGTCDSFVNLDRTTREREPWLIGTTGVHRGRGGLEITTAGSTVAAVIPCERPANQKGLSIETTVPACAVAQYAVAFAPPEQRVGITERRERRTVNRLWRRGEAAFRKGRRGRTAADCDDLTRGVGTIQVVRC